MPGKCFRLVNFCLFYRYYRIHLIQLNVVPPKVTRRPGLSISGLSDQRAIQDHISRLVSVDFN